MIIHRSGAWTRVLALGAGCAPLLAGPLPDIASVPADLEVPPLSGGPPAAGKRVKRVLPAKEGTAVHHVLYLPADWTPNATRKFPVLVEFAGNGPFRNNHGDVSSGKVQGSKLGYGISGGRGFIWLCLPYLDNAGRANVTRWWGTRPEYDPQPTIDYCRAAVASVCADFGGDADRVVLCGFSRGAIACNFIGLHDDTVAKLWAAFIPYSHYDGVNAGWPYPGADREAALARLKRLGNRPQFICSEGAGAEATRRYLESTGIKGRWTFRSTGFRNHNDAWVLRPSPARKELRAWLERHLPQAAAAP